MYTYDSRIAYSETDTDMILRVDALVDYFQNCSTFQTQDGPMDIDTLKNMGLVWVINSWQIDITRLPALGERVTIGTVPYDMKSFMGFRNFFMDTDKGERLAVANTVWSLIDMDKALPVRITPEIMAAYPLDERLPMEYLPRKISFPAVDNAADNLEVTAGERIVVSEHHLDSNLHVNNGQYIRIALDTAGSISSQKIVPARIRADYRKQARLGDIFFPKTALRSSQGQRVYTVSLDDETGLPYAIIEFH